jgi:hypothetical protein
MGDRIDYNVIVLLLRIRLKLVDNTTLQIAAIIFNTGLPPIRFHNIMKRIFFKTEVFWNVASCSVADRYPEDGGSRLLWNVGTYLSNYTASPAWKAVV